MGAALVAASIIVVVGIVDDRWGLDALTKFVGQVTAAGVLVVMGVSWIVIYDPFSASTLVLDQLQGGLITVAVAAVTINAMNFVDGLDGLAAGLGSSPHSRSARSPWVCCSIRAATSPPTPRPHGRGPRRRLPRLPAAQLPARQDLHGRLRSMLIGLMLAAISTSASGLIPLSAYGSRDLLGLLSPLILVGAVMFIPILDLLLAIVRRTRAGVSPFSPDKMHLHHRLLQIGHSHRRVVLLLYLWVGILAFGAVGSSLLDRRAVVLILAGGLVFALVVTAVPSLRRHDESGETPPEHSREVG